MFVGKECIRVCMRGHGCAQLWTCMWKPEVAVFLYCFSVCETESLTTPGALCFGQTVHPVSQPVGVTCLPLAHTRLQIRAAKLSVYTSARDLNSGPQICAASTLPTEPSLQRLVFLPALLKF